MDKTELAYKNAVELAKSHYENFPVVSVFLPKHIRKHVGIIYAFARIADDISDEGDLTSETRLLMLSEMETNLKEALEGNPKDDFWFALADTVKKFKLSEENLYKLLVAFKQDVIKKRFANFDEIKDYCTNSADPVGRIILEFFDIRSEEAFRYSDDICTALQLANFYQDVSVDILKNRIYVPLNEIKKFKYSEAEYMAQQYTPQFKELLAYQVERAGKLFENGLNLIRFLPVKLRVQILWTMYGGKKILEKVKKLEYNVLNYRPKLSKIEYLILMLKAIMARNRYAG